MVESVAFRSLALHGFIAEMNQRFHAGNLLHRIVELYVSIKDKIKRQIKKRINGRACIHLLIDEWTCKRLRQSFIAIRVR